LGESQIFTKEYPGGNLVRGTKNLFYGTKNLFHGTKKPGRARFVILHNSSPKTKPPFVHIDESG
jgi:hypothetical protein